MISTLSASYGNPRIAFEHAATLIKTLQERFLKYPIVLTKTLPKIVD
jgi:hypothetical protein